MEFPYQRLWPSYLQKAYDNICSYQQKGYFPILPLSLTSHFHVHSKNQTKISQTLYLTLYLSLCLKISFNVLLFCLFAFVDMSIFFSVTYWSMSFGVLPCHHVSVAVKKDDLWSPTCLNKKEFNSCYLLAV